MVVVNCGAFSAASKDKKFKSERDENLKVSKVVDSDNFEVLFDVVLLKLVIS